MKRIEAIFKPYKLLEVREALASLGVHNIVASEVEGCGRWHRQSERILARSNDAEFISKIKMEVVVADALCGPVSQAIIEAAKTGSGDDGHIFISEVSEAFPIGAQSSADKNGRFSVPQAV